MSTLPYKTPTFDSLYQVGQPEVTLPIPQDPTALHVRVNYECSTPSYTPGALDDPYVFNGVTYYLIIPGPSTWRDGPTVKFSRIYANTPATRNEFQSYEYEFPAFMGEGTDLFYLRYPYRKVVPSTLAYAYFHTTTPTASITQYAAFQPVINPPSGSYNYVNFLFDKAGTFYGSTPSYSGYLATYIGTPIVAEATTWRRWYGNFYEAITRYVNAE